MIHSRHPSLQSINQTKGAREALLRCYARASELSRAPRPREWTHVDRSKNEHLAMDL